MDRPIKACLVTPNLSLGGAERWVVDLVCHSDPERVAWTGVAVNGHGGADESLATAIGRRTKLFANYVPDRPASARPFFWPAFMPHCGPSYRDAIRAAAQDADVVVTWGSANMAEWFDGLAIPRVFCSHSSLAPDRITGITHLAAVSREAMRCFARSKPAADLPRAVLYNGADPKRIKPRRDRDEVRAEWGLGTGNIAVGYIGRQSPEKNYFAAARAVSRLPAHCHAVYCGSGPDGADMCPQLARWCERRIPGRFHVIPPVDHIGDVLAGLDVLVLASHREAFSLTMIESWLAGVPVVATPVGAVPELEAKYGPLTFGVPEDPAPKQVASAIHTALWSQSQPTPDDLLDGGTVNSAREVAGAYFTTAAMASRWATYLEYVVETGQ
jgi:glycosyltransferase involved in cell wall biosynthesis